MAITAQDTLGFRLLETGLNGNFDEAMTLLRNGADPAFSDLRGNNFLHIARFRNHRDFYNGISAYLNEHAETDDYDTNLNFDRHTIYAIRMGGNPLYEIARTPDQLREVAERTTDIWLQRAERRREEDLNLQDYANNNDTLLHGAARTGSYEAMRHLILERGAMLHLKNNDDQVFLDLLPEEDSNLKSAIKGIVNNLFLQAATADYSTVEEAHAKAVAFVQSGVDLDFTCPLTGQTALHKAASSRKIQFLTSLIGELPKGQSTNDLIYKKDTVNNKAFYSYLEGGEYYKVMDALTSSGHLGYPARAANCSSKSGNAVGNAIGSTVKAIVEVAIAAKPIFEVITVLGGAAETYKQITAGNMDSSSGGVEPVPRFPDGRRPRFPDGRRPINPFGPVFPEIPPPRWPTL
jgi:ankyrin repeat protein